MILKRPAVKGVGGVTVKIIVFKQLITVRIVAFFHLYGIKVSCTGRIDCAQV
ncbi:hypothetical protein SDC9_122790 [bioreactor metagenome]|uniref:Uncharacterized protein n=1 Tax=bioreactor metagenome TaxID=1076179 RepID=A0A645CFM8_9ZZZZ